MLRYIFSFFILICGVLACKKINNPKPPCDAQELAIPQDTSFLSTPLVIPTQLIEDKLNQAIGEKIIEDDDFENPNQAGKKDKLKLKITRLGDIQVVWKDNVARYQAPLLVLIQRQIVSKNVLPSSKSLALKTEFSLRLAFETTVDIGEDWQLQPSTKLVSFEWLSPVKALGGLIDVKKMVERRLNRQLPQILDNVDSTIRAKVRLEKVLTRVWRNLQKPMVINRKEHRVWLKITPIQFELGTITTEPGNLLIQCRLSATTETLLGDNPEFSIDSILPPLIKRRELPNTTYLYMLSKISYSDINQVIAEKLKGKGFDISGHRINIKSADVWGCGPNLVLHLRVGGAVRGDLYFQGSPLYEPGTQQISIQNFDYEVSTEEALVSSAEWLLHSTFKEEIKSALSIQLATHIVKIPEAIMAGIERGRAGKKMDFTIEEWDFQPQKIWVGASDLAVLIIVNAKVRVELERI